MSRYLAVLFALLLLLGFAFSEDFYKGYCSSCHMPDARGIPGLYPPLRPMAMYLCLSEGRAYLIRTTLFGLVGPIRVQGIEYRGTRVMPAFGDWLDDEGIALILNDLLRVIEAKVPAFRMQEVRTYRTPRLTPNEVYRLREELLSKHPKPPCS